MTKITNEYDKELKQIMDAMRLKLHINRHKGKWENQSLDQLFIKLQEEVEELKDEIEGGNQIAMVLEAADIAVYAMIIVNVALKVASGEHKEMTKEPQPISSILIDFSKKQAPQLQASEEDIRKALGYVL